MTTYAIYGLPTPPSLGYDNVIFPFALISSGALSAGILMYLEFLTKRMKHVDHIHMKSKRMKLK